MAGSDPRDPRASVRDEAGQLVHEGDTEPDAEPQMVGEALAPVGRDGELRDPDADREDIDASPSAEEAAMRIVDEDDLPGGVDAPTDGYGDDQGEDDDGED